MSTTLQDKTYILLTLPTMKNIKMVAKEWTDDKMFQVRNDIWTGKGLICMGKNILGKRIIVFAK